MLMLNSAPTSRRSRSPVLPLLILLLATGARTASANASGWQSSAARQARRSGYSYLPFDRDDDQRHATLLASASNSRRSSSLRQNCINAISEASILTTAPRRGGPANQMGGSSLRLPKASTVPKLAPSAAKQDQSANKHARRPLTFYETMICGAVSRTLAQTVMHPANCMKTLLQSSSGNSARAILTSQPLSLLRGAGSNFILSMPHGALNFAVLEFVRQKMDDIVPPEWRQGKRVGPLLDFGSSAISTIACSVVSTPQMMITDNVMVGNYPNLVQAAKGLYQQHSSIRAFYAGLVPGLAGKIPGYAFTWVFFNQLKQARDRISDRPAKNYENTIMGCMASAASVCLMIPMDTIKTRLVTQGARAVAATAAGSTVAVVPYKGIVDCAVRVAREEGIIAFYRGLAPRLISVVPMVGLNFGCYEFMKKVVMMRDAPSQQPRRQKAKEVEQGMMMERLEQERVIEEAALEVGASPEVPTPVLPMHRIRGGMRFLPKGFRISGPAFLMRKQMRLGH